MKQQSSVTRRPALTPPQPDDDLTGPAPVAPTQAVVPASEKAVAPLRRNELLPGYFDSRTIDVLGKRLRNLPAYSDVKKVPYSWLVNLAQAALTLQLNPFTGEICLIPDESKGGAFVFIQAAGRWRKSQAQLQREGGQGAAMWYDHHELNEEEKLNWHVPVDAVAVLVELKDNVTRRAYDESLKAIMPVVEAMLRTAPAESAKGTAHYALDVIEGLIGKSPTTIGLGYLTKQEATTVNSLQSGAVKSRAHYPVYNKALKRALTAALKGRFHIDLPAFEIDSAEINEYLAQTLDSFRDSSGVWTVSGQDTSSEPSIDDLASAGPAEEVVDALEQGQSLKCTVIGCNHVIEVHGLNGRCESQGCHCLRYIGPSAPPTGEALQSKFTSNKHALGRDGGGLD